MLTIPFGKYRGKPVDGVPSSYLQWVLRECKPSHGLRAAIARELTRRGAGVPAPTVPPAAGQPPRCLRCPSAPALAMWQEDVRGNKRIRAECSRCRGFLCWAPQVEPFVSQANAASSPTAILDVVIEAEERGIALESDGHGIWLEGDVPDDLRRAAYECSHRLAVLLGDTSRRQRR